MTISSKVTEFAMIEAFMFDISCASELRYRGKKKNQRQAIKRLIISAKR